MIQSYLTKPTMPVIKYPLWSCAYETPDIEASVVTSLLIIHNNVNNWCKLFKTKASKDGPSLKRERV